MPSEGSRITPGKPQHGAAGVDRHPVRALSLVAAALGLGFYRFWHVPAPDAGCDATDTRRADRSMVGPAALAVLAAGCLLAGRVGTAVLLHQRVTAPFAALPLAGQALVGLGCLTAVLAVGWWLLSAPARVRVGHDLHRGTVVRLPDDPPAGHEALHAAATELGRVLLDRRDRSAEAAHAAVLLGAVADVLGVRGAAVGDDEAEARMRRQCLATARRLHRAGEPTSTAA